MASLSVLIENLIRNRHARLVVAFGLIALGAWAFLPHVTYRVAPTAFVNAELLRITAPISGRVAPDLPRKGEIVERPVTVKLAETWAPDRRHLLDLEQQHVVAQERADLAQRQIEEIAAFDRELDARIEAYRAGTIERIARQIAEAEAEKIGCLAELQQRRDIDTRMGQLAKSGYTSQIRSAEAAAQQEANAARCAMADVRMERLKVERDAAQRRVFLHDGANDVPYSQQQRDRLMLRRQELQTEMLQQKSRAAQLAMEIAAERERLGRISQSEVVLPGNHVVWSVSASPGSAVMEGQTILDLADCARRFVVVELREREFEKVRAGDPAWVRLVGSSDWRRGVVRQVRGSAARTDDRLLAAQVPHPATTTMIVEVALPPERTGAERNIFCNIGRMAEVRFQRAMFGLADRVAAAWARLTGSNAQTGTVGQAGAE